MPHFLRGSLPPLGNRASSELQEIDFSGIMSGEETICLAVTEPDAGADVRGIKATAEKTADGKYYVVDGRKKWITNGMGSGFFMTLVRTGGSGQRG